MWLYQVPIAIALPLFVALFVAVSLTVVLALRKWVPRDGDRADEWDRVLRYSMASYGVLYGVTLALIAAASYENYRGVEEIVLQETSAISVLYRDASGFPEPTSTDLQVLLLEYTDDVISVDWVRQAGERASDGATMQVSADLPAVISITEALPDARFPNFKGIMAAKKKPFETLTLQDLGIEPEDPAASRSIVLALSEKPPRQAGTKIVDEGDAGEKLAEFLVQNRLV